MALGVSDAQLNIIIDAQNKAKAAFNEVQNDMKGIKGKLEDMKPAFQKMAMVGVAAFGALSAVIVTSVKASGEAAKVQAQLGAVLKSTGGIAGVTAEKAIELSKSLQKVSTFGDEAILSAENMLLTFTNISKEVFPDAIQTVLDMSVALGQDLKSSSIQLGKALQDPIQGVSALRRVGINFTETQQDMIKGMVEAGDIMGAQKFILAELATEFGGSAQAQAQTFAGRIQQVKEQISDLQEGIGNALIPVITQLVNKIQPVVERMIAWAEKNPELIKQIIIISGVLSGFLLTVGLLGLALPAVITGFWFLISPIGLVVVAIIALVAVGVLVMLNWKKIKVFFQQTWEGIVIIIKETCENIRVFLTNLWNSIVNIFTEIGYFIRGVVLSWASILRPVWEPIVNATKIAFEWVKIQIQNISDFISSVFIKLKEVLTPIWQGIVNVIKTVWDSIKTYFSDIWESIKNVFSNAIDWLMGKIQPFLNAVQKVKSVASSIGGFIGSNISAIKDIGKAGLLPHFQGGGIVQGAFGTPVPILAHAGEMVIPAGRSLGNVNITITGNTFMSDREAAEKIGDMIINKLKLQMRF